MDIQDSLQLRGILRYIAGRHEELKVLAEGTFAPSDCQNFALALQMVCLIVRSYVSNSIGPSSSQDLRNDVRSGEDRQKLGDALCKLVLWTKLAPPIPRRMFFFSF